MIKSALSVLSVLLLGMSASVAGGQEETADSLELHFDEVIPGQEMMHRNIVDESGVHVGVVDDVVLDVNNGRVAFLLVKRNKSAGDDIGVKGERPEYFPVVLSVLQEWKSDQPLKLSILLKRVQDSPAAMRLKPLTFLSETELAATFKHYEADLYWKSQKGVDASPSLMSVDELDGRLIRDSDQIKFGRIEEVLLSPEKNWTIAFLALSQFRNHKSGEDRIAVPLSAFARRSTTGTWLLDIPKEARLPGETFNVGTWPSKIDAGWREFTHVKYGASVEGGIQNLDSQKADSAK